MTDRTVEGAPAGEPATGAVAAAAPGAAVSPTPGRMWRTFVTEGMSQLAILSFADPAWAAFDKRTGGRVNRRVIRGVLAAAVALHIGEAVAARRLAVAKGVDQPGRWALQTLAWGFPVLARLRAVDSPPAP